MEGGLMKYTQAKNSGKSRKINRSLHTGDNFQAWRQQENLRILNTPNKQLSYLEYRLKQQLELQQYRSMLHRPIS